MRGPAVAWRVFWRPCLTRRAVWVCNLCLADRYSRWGKPHLRCFALNQEEAKLEWWGHETSDNAASDDVASAVGAAAGGTAVAHRLGDHAPLDLARRPDNPSKVKSVDLGAIEGVAKGKTTTVLEKRASGAPDARCLSLVIAAPSQAPSDVRSSVDIELPSERDRDAFVQGLVLLGVQPTNFVLSEYVLYHLCDKPDASGDASAPHTKPSSSPAVRRRSSASLLGGGSTGGSRVLPAAVVSELLRTPALEQFALHRRVGGGSQIVVDGLDPFCEGDATTAPPQSNVVSEWA